MCTVLLFCSHVSPWKSWILIRILAESSGSETAVALRAGVVTWAKDEGRRQGWGRDGDGMLETEKKRTGSIKRWARENKDG